MICGCTSLRRIVFQATLGKNSHCFLHSQHQKYHYIICKLSNAMITSFDLSCRISDYLRLAMNDAFKEFVHVSTRTWLTLMGCANFIYFTMGMITYAASSTSSSSSSSSYDYNEIVPIALSWIFIGYCIFFVVVSFLISIKMDAIFKQIIAKDSWIQVDSSLVSKPGFFARGLIGTSWSTSKGSLSINDKSQKDQFWFRKPDLIITFAQLMQFGL